MTRRRQQAESALNLFDIVSSSESDHAASPVILEAESVQTLLHEPSSPAPSGEILVLPEIDDVCLDDEISDTPPKPFGNLTNPSSHSGYPLWLGAIHITHVEGPELTQFDRQIWTYLVALAYERMSTADEHRVTYKAIREQISERMVLVHEDGERVVRRASSAGHESNDRIRESITKLQKTIVAWDIFREDNRSKALKAGERQSQLLGSAGFEYQYDENGERVLLYSFPVHLRPLLSNPQTYSYLRTRVVFSFTSLYALRLYESLQRHADRRVKPWRVTLDVEKLRLLLGVKPGQLAGFGNLKQRALDPALEQINAFAEFDVACDFVRGTGRGAPVKEIVLTISAKSETAAVRALYDANKTKAERMALLRGAAAERDCAPTLPGLETPGLKRVSKFSPST